MSGKRSRSNGAKISIRRKSKKKVETASGSDSVSSSSSSSSSGSAVVSGSKGGGVLDGSNSNHNELVTKLLGEVGKMEQLAGKHFKAISYFKAVNVIKKYHKSIESRQEAIALPGIGKNIANKIEEILETGSLKKLEEGNRDDKLIAIESLSKIPFLTTSKVRMLYEKHGITSIAELKQKTHLLDNEGQRLCLDKIKDINTKRTAAEAHLVCKFLSGLAHSIDPKAQFTVTGEHRRGCEAHKLHCIVTHPELKSAKKKLDNLILQFGDAFRTNCGMFHVLKRTSNKITALLIVNKMKNEAKESLKDKSQNEDEHGFAFSIPSADEIQVAEEANIAFLRDTSLKKEEEKPDKGAEANKLVCFSKCMMVELEWVVFSRYPTLLLWTTGSKEFLSKLQSEAQKRNMELGKQGIKLKLPDGTSIPLELEAGENSVFDLLDMSFIEPEKRFECKTE